MGHLEGGVLRSGQLRAPARLTDRLRQADRQRSAFCAAASTSASACPSAAYHPSASTCRSGPGRSLAYPRPAPLLTPPPAIPAPLQRVYKQQTWKEWLLHRRAVTQPVTSEVRPRNLRRQWQVVG